MGKLPDLLKAAAHFIGGKVKLSRVNKPDSFIEGRCTKIERSGSKGLKVFILGDNTSEPKVETIKFITVTDNKLSGHDPTFRRPHAPQVLELIEPSTTGSTS